MFKHDDAFIALPGGLGTLEEIFHISSWAQLHIHHKLQSFIPVIDPSMSRINWSTKESRKKLRLDLSLCL
jgi:predicted Rossmann-fold nucleotide-binding protein